MIRGYYTAASGLISQQKRLNSVSNNLANVSTTGYKRSDLVFGTFGDHITKRMNAYQRGADANIGPGTFMQVVDEKFTTYEQGGFEATSRPMDMAIMGEGFFVVTADDGTERLTRDGQFSLDAEGFLVLPGYGRVQGQDGDIEIGQSEFSVDSLGNIYIMDEDGEEEEIGRLSIAIPDDNDYTALEKYRDGLYVGENYTIFDVDNVDEDTPVPFAIRQEQLERSNVNMSDEMTNMIASQRALQSCSQIVKMYDDMADRISTQVSRV